MPEAVRYPPDTRRPQAISQPFSLAGGRRLTLRHRWLPGAVRDGGQGAVFITLVSEVGAVLGGPRKLVVTEDLFGRWRGLLANPDAMPPGRWRCYRVEGSGGRGDPTLTDLGTGDVVVEYVSPEEDE